MEGLITVPWQAAYHGFGHAEVDVSSTITNNIRFPGRYFDAGTNLLSLSYGYDASGNVTSITDTIGSAPGQYIDSTTYAYESGTNRLTTITGTPTATLTHDAGGNITSEGTRTFTYDLTNRLAAVTDNQTEIASYVYDARNLRVKKTTPSETRIFHYDVTGHLIAETDTAGNTLVEYVYLSDMPLATVRPTDTVYYFHTDHINTPRVITNSAGTVAWQAAYHGFGHAEVDVSSTITNNIRFPGQYFDAETNLHYNWNRYYDPRTGRYLTPDPIGLEGGIDPFVYAENSPVNLVDPSGLLQQCRSGLDALGGLDFGPFHHEYQCWSGPGGRQVCRGYGRDPNSTIRDAVFEVAPAKILKDKENVSHGKKKCKSDDKNKCMDECAARSWQILEDNIHEMFYSVKYGVDCNTIQRRIYDRCKKECAK